MAYGSKHRASDDARLFFVREILNYGGFFGGEIVTLAVERRGAPADTHTLTIDQRALANVRDRHALVAGMLLALDLAGERVERAELVGATAQAELRAALGGPQLDAPLAGPQVLSYRCDECGLWVAGAPTDGACRICSQRI